MEYQRHWTKVRSVICRVTAAFLFVTFCAFPTSATPPSSHTNLNAAKLKEILRRVSTERANCAIKKCARLKTLKEYEKVLKTAMDDQQRVALLTQENLTLRDQEENIEKSLPFTKSKGCQKPKILAEKMLDLGINENGSMIYSKRPAGMEGANCWANSRRKKETTAVLCEFPLAINILTKGGKPQNLTQKTQEYIFDLNACNLVSVRITEENIKGKKQNFLALPTCLKEWNKRTADAAMTKAEVDKMQETIRMCFQYNLLPPQHEDQKKPQTENAGLKK